MSLKVSIVMPTYNRADSFLKQAISSVLSQGFSDFELIIIDDASTDNTESLVQSFNDKRIVYVKTAQNQGEYWSTNYAVNMARAKYLTWVHSDDLLPKDSLRQRVKVLEDNPSLDFVHGDIVKIDEKGKIIQKVESVSWPKAKIISQYLLLPREREKKYVIHHTTVMMKWNFFYKAGPFDCSLPFAGDIDWLMRAIKIGNFSYIPQTLYYYRSHKDTRRVVDIKNGIDEEKINRMIIRRYEKA